ncbi:topoisomerase I [Coprinopsis marcescibilis]|uniref:DNA topoisomerase I n=1 Tax=Coprinopsis marcescibilis TaxID=230819 RepID=A0A5C3KNP2_COPMA|nr:topoisomerase I [Coprinopsis marcescibilis]
MSGDVAMLSDDERTLAPKPTANGQPPNGKGSVNGHANEVPMSDEDDDVPLSQATSKSELDGRPSRTLKRKKPIYAESSSSDDDVPLASSPAKPTRQNGNGKVKAVKKEETDDDEPSELASKTNKRARAPSKKQPPKKKVKEETPTNPPSSEDEAAPPVKTTARKRKAKVKAEESEADVPPPPKKAASKSRKKVKKEEPESDADIKPKTNGRSRKQPAGSESPAKGKGKKKEEEDEDEVFKWWEATDANGDGTQKWQTLEHNGVFFPPAYEPLPSHVKMQYDGQDVDLPPQSEEVAGFYGAMLDTDHARDSVFNKNFFDDFKKVLERYPPRCGTQIETFELCNFRPMLEHFETEKAKKKAMTAEEKKAAKKARDEAEAKYTTCVLDGRKEKVGNFRVEPPGLFRGRGEHPKKGSLKKRVRPEDITINIGSTAPIPVPNMPGKWKSVIHDKTVTWLATWTENINGNHKYVFLAAGSSLKGQSDMQKFEKARELKGHIDKIRADYTEDLKSKVMADRQRATAMYFIDELALRAGNEKGEDEADTVGCCSLRCEHVTLEPPNFVVFDFLGKDSIRYYNRVQVDQRVFKNIRIFKENKEPDDNLFDRVTTTALNKHLTSQMKGLTAKVFRTFNASRTFQRLLDEQDLSDATLQEKLNAYNKANREVAILCNHQRAAPKTHDQSMEKMKNKLRALKYERMKLRHVFLTQEPKMKKSKKYKDAESDLDDDWIEEHEESLKAKEIEKVEKRFAKENEKLEAEDKKPMKDSVLKERIEYIEEEYARLAKERGTGKATLKRERPSDKLEEAIDKITEKIHAFKLQMIDRDEGKEVALGTSKINYLDPRITVAWCNTHDVPIEKIFSKTLLSKFPWAMGVDNVWKF